MRGQTRRTWVKFFITGWLHGSVRWQLDSAERGVFADLICFAGECNRDGAICDNDGKPYPLDFVANQFNITRELLDRTIVKCAAEGRIEERDGIIILTNFKIYNSEYARQKPYRVKAKDKKVYGSGQDVSLADDEYRKLVNLFGESGTMDRIENLSIYIQSKGDKYKSHYATILNWDRLDKKRGTVRTVGARTGTDRSLPDRNGYTKPEEWLKQ